MSTVELEPAEAKTDQREPFVSGLWTKEVNVRDFIQANYTPYYGDESFLAGPTARTLGIWKKLTDLFVEERKKGVLDVSQIPSSITSHEPGYIDKDNELIVGLQTEAPLKRAIMPNGGLNMVLNAFKAYGYEADPMVVEIFTKYRKTHNAGVFDAYTEDVRRCRRSHVLTGLPDAYGRGRIIGDYRRVALYGVDRLVARKKEEKSALDREWTTESIIRDREELSEQIRSLGELKEMASKYGFDVSGPATSAREAVQWLYFAYLACVKEQNGAAMSLGRVSTFLDVYLERDLKAGLITEEEAQELVDDFVIKLRIVRSCAPRVRRAVLRRSDLGDRVHRRHGRRRAATGDQDQLPRFAHALQPRAGAGTEPDGVVHAAAARAVPPLRRQGRDRHQRDPVRKRRDHARGVGRRRSDRLLRLADGGRQADAVLRRARQPREGTALCDQRRPR
jgi:formate C-acetyltransferase